MLKIRLAAVVFVSLLHISCIFAFFFTCLFNPSLFLWLNKNRQGSEVNNFLKDVQDLHPLQKEKKIKKQRKGLGTD